jgi:parvulin-like peptidyl-prolyl isomerase
MDSSSAKKDGSLGYVVKGQMVSKFEKALFKLLAISPNLSGFFSTSF